MTLLNTMSEGVKHARILQETVYDLRLEALGCMMVAVFARILYD